MPVRHSVEAAAVLALLDEDELQALRDETGDTEAHDATYLIAWLTRKRGPFIQMASEVCGLLTSLETFIRGNISFVVLPDEAAELALNFNPQMRAATATALRLASLGSADTAEKLDVAYHGVIQLIDRMRPRSVTRYDSTGEALRELADMTPDPRERVLRQAQAEYFRSEDLEFNAEDIAGIERIATVARDVQRLGVRLLGDGPVERQQGRRADLAEALRSRLSAMATLAERKQQEARSRRSGGYPQAPRALADSDYAVVQQRLHALRRALLAASEAEDATSELFDFYSLAMWRQRWRLYELWLLARLVDWMVKLGAVVSDTDRIVDGRWLLKFTRDALPILGLDWAGRSFDVFYQYFDAKGGRGNMPDLALKLRGGDFILVLNPKHGESYSRKELNEVCLRYAKAFAPAASCVMNYFSRANPIERLADDPACVVLYGVNPGGELLQVLEAEFGAARQSVWRRGRWDRSAVAVLMDVSDSAAGIRDVLREECRQALVTRLFDLSPV